MGTGYQAPRIYRLKVASNNMHYSLASNNMYYTLVDKSPEKGNMGDDN